MESESTATNTKISDSGYSVSCSNSNSQRSASSKSRHSGSNSSRSSGYCGGNSNADGSLDIRLQPPKRNKEKDHKSKKGKMTNYLNVENNSTATSPVQSNTTSSGVETALGNKVAKCTDETETNYQASDNLDGSKDRLHTANNNVSADDMTMEQNLPLWADVPCSPAEKDENKTLGFPDIEGVTDNVPVNETAEETKDGFCCVISMYDGVVLYTTPSLTAVLGFPKDMWIGRSFLGYIHPKDRDTFSNQISNTITVPLIKPHRNYKDLKLSFYVCLRRYRGLRNSGFGVVEKSVAYQTFQLTVTFRTVDTPEYLNSAGSMFLVIVAIPIYSPYKAPDEARKSSKFVMRHTASCIFNHVDPEVVENFGFLPQDMLGKSVFDFYHPEDMPFLKEVYESVIEMCQMAGSVFRSKPYRFAVQNGGFAVIETEWSSFVNPWSRRLEFVIGLHRVLQGPANPDIFHTPNENKKSHVSEEILKESKEIQGEILILLSKELPKPNDSVKQEVTKRCKDLAIFMEKLMGEVSKSTLQLGLPHHINSTISERESVMLGEISPHHDYYDSKSSSETPPSYNQLNYNENIQRFFESRPKTTVSDESVEQNSTENGLLSEQDCSNNQKCLSPIQNSGESGSGSAGNSSSGSNHIVEAINGNGGHYFNDSYAPPHLTEALLNKHNEDMEKIMVKRHKEQRCSSKGRDKKSHPKLDKILGDTLNDMQVMNSSHGIKRSGSHSYEGDNHKFSKYTHHQSNRNLTEHGNTVHNHGEAQNATATVMSCGGIHHQSSTNDINLWPPFSVTVTPVNNTQSCSISSNHCDTATFAAGMLPVYCIPTQSSPSVDPQITSEYQVQYMPSMIYNYNTIFPPSPIVCSPLPLLSLPIPRPMMPLMPEQRQTHTHTHTSSLSNNNPPPERKISPSKNRCVLQFQRPASQATSVKAEPGSGMGSIASVNRAMSDSSRKDLGVLSVCSPDSPLVSPPVGERELDGINLSQKAHNHSRASNIQSNYCIRQPVDEDSSYSSSYSSFFKTDTESGNDSNAAENKAIKSDNDNWQRPKVYPLRKRDPPWLEAVSVTPELIYRYQMAVRRVEDILEEDLNSLKQIHQSVLVNSQLNQLYVEMELEGLPSKLILDEGITSSSSSGEEVAYSVPKSRKRRKSYSSLMMIYEENAPFPPPDK